MNAPIPTSTPIHIHKCHSKLSLILSRLSSDRRLLQIDRTSSSRSHTSHTNRRINITIRILLLGLEANDLEDVDREAVGGVVELFVETLAHVLLVDGFVDEGFDEWLRVPV